MTDWAAFLVVAVVIVVVPGVDFALVSQQVLARGRRAGLAAAGGIMVGSAVQGGAAVLGLSALLAASEPAFAALRVVGAVYLVWLGGRALWSTRRSARTGGDAEEGAALSVGSGRRAFRTGVLTNLLNPKMIVFYVSLLPQFVAPGPDAPVRTALLALTFLAVAGIWLLLCTAVLARLRGVLSRTVVRRWMERVTGAVLVGLGVRLAVET